MPKKLTAEDFIEKARQVHGDKYDYHRVVYICNRKKVKIICPEHGMFLQTPKNHIFKNGCPQCGAIKRAKGAIKRVKHTKESCHKKALKCKTKKEFKKKYQKEYYAAYEYGWVGEICSHMKNLKPRRHITSEGYVKIIITPDDLFFSSGHRTKGYKNRNILEHRYIMANHLGRALKKTETVHHINGNRQDNRIENLELKYGPHGSGATELSKDISRLLIENNELKNKLKLYENKSGGWQ
jgi:hypothetical protein